ncbi:MAG TPA: GNAT family N-acetyltransferase [Acidobacteriaceae bacterium]
MSAAIQPEILDLRHYSAQSLRPVLEEESRVWSERLAWDYRASTDLLLQYLDARVLPGFVAVEEGRVIGYAFCVYEDRKAIIGDVFAVSPRDAGSTKAQVELLLLEHMLELLTHSPGVERIESQLLLHTHDQHAAVFERSGFQIYRRIFMEHDLQGLSAPALQTQQEALAAHGYVLRGWQEADFNAAGSLIARAYEGHLDSVINDQYRSVAGSLRFLHNIIRFPGCGHFDPRSSRVVEQRGTGAMVGMLLCSQVRQDVGHVTQACVVPSARGMGLGTLMLQSAMQGLAGRGFSRLSLTVTEDNWKAVALYRRLGFVEQHRFDAMVWTAPGAAPLFPR